MDKVKLFGIALACLLLVSSPSPAKDIQVCGSAGSGGDLDAWRPIITAASKRFGIPASWIRAVMQAESGGRLTIDGKPITSKAGAMGLMQVMPETFAEIRQRYGLGPDPYDPETNILAGAAYLAELYRRFGFPALFAAYNAGPQRYAEHLQTGDPLPGETIYYLKTIGAIGLEARKMIVNSARNSASISSADTSSSSLFFARNTAKPNSIFVPLRSSDELSQ